jgi:hypothetical protein
MLAIDRNSPVGLRLAYRFWIELGRPTKFNNRRTMEEWAPKMESLFRKSGLDYMGFKWFVIWALRLPDEDGAKYGNEFTARNLRAAHDPMVSLVKQFMMTFFEVFMPKADKVVHLLVEKREREEAEVRLAQAAAQPAKWADILSEDAEPWEKEKARHQDAVEARFRHHAPMAGETAEVWIKREFRHLRNPDWRCPFCVFGVSLDGEDDVRTKWCSDCAEERRMCADEDRECMCAEVESVSDLTTRPWDLEKRYSPFS